MANSLDVKYLDSKILARASLLVKMFDIEIIGAWAMEWTGSSSSGPPSGPTCAPSR
jgi:hypothetical protein